MGTTYSIKLVEENIDSIYIHNSIENILENINSQMSTYIDSSCISKFNNLEVGDSLNIKSDFNHVFNKSHYYHSLTNGSFEVTIKPLIDLWGFEKPDYRTNIPDSSSIKRALTNIGINNIKIRDGYIYKMNEVSLDFSALAKGYAVDKIATFLKDNLIYNFMVEIGGELSLSGYNSEDKKWSIGVQNPSLNNISSTLNLLLTNKAIATSGNYRNFFTHDGKSYSHIISPTTGYPIDKNILSVTVISDQCIDADALATSLIVMNIEDGIDLIDKIKGTEVFYITKENENLYSKGFKTFVR
ncbi:MAG: hypothetical protein CMG26_03145 [Candidatus Marinimicrobia bacterium]|nr:hypothetical protein [Candidatus Neomarinimicrobiota bacterium]